MLEQVSICSRRLTYFLCFVNLLCLSCTLGGSERVVYYGWTWMEKGAVVIAELRVFFGH